jgi:hypothetical protein
MLWYPQAAIQKMHEIVTEGEPLREAGRKLDAELADLAAALPLVQALRHGRGLRCSLRHASPAASIGAPSGGLLVTIRLSLDADHRLPCCCSLLLTLQTKGVEGTQNGWAVGAVPHLRGGGCAEKTVLVPGSGQGPLAVLRVWLVLVGLPSPAPAPEFPCA